MRAVIAFGLGLVLTLAAAPARAEDEKAIKGPEGLVGSYIYVRAERGGDDVPKDRLTGKVKITTDKIYLLNAEGGEDFVIEYTLDAAASPCKVSMKITEAPFDEAVSTTAKGLVKAEGDSVTIIYAYGEASAPSDFKTKDRKSVV